MNMNPILLVLSGLRIGDKFCCSVSKEDYSCFSGIFDEARQRESAELAYHALRASAILSSGATKHEYVLLLDRIH